MYEFLDTLFHIQLLYKNLSLFKPIIKLFYFVFVSSFRQAYQKLLY